MAEEKYAAIVLSAGKGKRMNSAVPKQYLMLNGKPVLYYSLLAFEKSMVDHIILVTGEDEVEYCKTQIIEKYGLKKVRAVTTGGKERYHSVFQGLKILAEQGIPVDYIMIHDGARPFLENAVIDRCARAVQKFHACAAGMPVKDTIKIADQELFAAQTPRRSDVWMIQTPQAFDYPLIYGAYQKLLEQEETGEGKTVTDDAMVIEEMTDYRVKLVEGSYQNIKITTPEDLKIAAAFCEKF